MCAVLIEFVQVSVYHSQMLQGKGLHTIELCVACQQSIFISIAELHHLVDVFLTCEIAGFLAKIGFIYKFLDTGNLTVYSPAVANCSTRLDSGDGIF